MAIIDSLDYEYIDINPQVGGDTYRHKLKDVIGRALIAPTETSNTASIAHVPDTDSGYFIYNNSLYCATINIAQGDTIAPGTNCKTVTVGGELGKGISTYVHIKYAQQQPTQDSDMSSTPGPWMGIYTGTSATAPTHYTDYVWNEVKGPQGDDYVLTAADKTEIAGIAANELQPTITELNEEKADKDGDYPNMTAGNADQLLSTVGVQDKVPYNLRTSGGSIEIGDREVDKIIGGTVAWNQLAKYTGFTAKGVTFSVDGNIMTVNGTAKSDFKQNDYNSVLNLMGIPGNHVVCFIGFDGKSKIGLRYIGQGYAGAFYSVSGNVIQKPTSGVFRFSFIISAGTTFDNETFTLPIVIDLTKMFGPTIADYIYSLGNTNGVAWFRALFPKDYYAYDAGTLRSVQVSAHKMVGFNAYDNTTGKALVIGGSEYEITGTYTALTLDGESITPISGKFTPAKSGELTVTGGDSTTCVHLRWNGDRDGDFEPYKSVTYALDSSLELRGMPKLDANNRLYYDGDEYESNGTVTRRYGIIDLGTLTWRLAATNVFISDAITNIKFPAYSVDITDWIACPKYTPSSPSRVYNLMDDKAVAVQQNTGCLLISDTSYSDAATFKTAMSGVMLVYELAAPTTESVDPYQNPQIVDDFGTEQYIDAGNRDVEIPVGHETFYPQNLRKKIEGLPWNFNNLIAPTEETYIATQPYSAGDMFIVNNILYRAKTSIANGATITPGTNCEQITLATSTTPATVAETKIYLGIN